ncbi:MAG: carboxypeptidase regulatory-like domain-containing protein [Planctomycetota bacterium]|nr:carboxypeptidase regulatory-like domain-containing protein [Planctomycetota bacterium]
MKKMILAVGLLLSCSVSAIAEDWGTISGQFVVTGEIPALELLHGKGAPVKDPAVCAAVNTFKDDLIIDADSKGLANVFVYLVKAPKSIHPDLKKPDPAVIVFDQKGCMFTPHAMVILGGQTVEVISSDAIAHNTHTYPIKNQGMNVLVAANTPVGKGLAVEYKIGESLPIKVACDFHPWMQAYWMVVDHPYAAVTDKDGKFTIPNLPVGEHEFRVWHERKGYLDRKYAVKVQKGDNQLMPVEVKIDDLKAK